MVAVVIGDDTVGTDYPGTEDNALREGSPTQNRGTQTIINVNKIAAGNHWHTLLSFSGLSNLPATLTVTSAYVSLYLSAASGSTSQTHTLKPILRNWGENTSNWNTWDGSASWSTPGCLSDGNDRRTTASDTITGVTNTTGVRYNSGDSTQMQSDVEDFVDGTLTNYGWHTERTDAANDAETRDYSSSDGTDGQRPRLYVVYTTGGTTETVSRGNILFKGYAVAETVHKTKSAQRGNILLKGYAITESYTVTETVSKGTLIFKGYAVTEAAVSAKTVSRGNIQLKGYAVSETRYSKTILPEKGTLLLKGYAVTETRYSKTILPQKGTIIFRGYPVVGASFGSKTKAVSNGRLFFKGYEITELNYSWSAIAAATDSWSSIASSADSWSSIGSTTTSWSLIH